MHIYHIHSRILFESMDKEAQPLLSSKVTNNVSLCSPCERFTCVHCWPRVRYLCLSSKVILLILAWTVIVSELYTVVQVSIEAVIAIYVPIGENHLVNALSSPIGFVYAILAVIAMFYPLSGFLADVCCGRFKTVIVGLSIILISSISFVVILALSRKHNHHALVHVPLNESVPLLIFAFSAAFFIVIGYAVYQANFIQLGLDQLIEAPSNYLSHFIHWAVWADTLGTAIVTISLAVLSCPLINDKVKAILCVIPVITFFCFPLIMFLTCWKRHWFYTEPGQRNPYKTVIKVLNFVRKHEYPLQRSAFTYCDDERPSRIDYAKERYGGPFTTEQVEDVKTFVRILTLLASLGPLFVMDVSSSTVGFAFFGQHTGSSQDRFHHCTIWTLLDTGALRYVVGSILLPVYIYIQFFLLKSSFVSKMLARLFIGLVLYIFGILSMLAIELAGHLHSVNDQGTGSHCMLAYTRNNSTHALMYPVLEMHWAVLIPPSVLLGIGPPIVTTTTFEFISACLLYTSPSPRDATLSRMPSSA